MTHRDGQPRVSSPLSPVGDRFPLGWDDFASPVSDEPVSRRGVRPYGMRFAARVDRRGELSGSDGERDTTAEQRTPDYVGDGAA